MLQVLSGVAQVVASVHGQGRLELFALRRAGSGGAILAMEAYDDAGRLVAGGEVTVWELNQAIAALLAATTQARRLTLRDDGRGHGGHLDVVVGGGAVDVVAGTRDARVAFTTTPAALVADLNALVRHYLALSRGAAPARTIVLPGQPAPTAASRVS